MTALLGQNTPPAPALHPPPPRLMLPDGELARLQAVVRENPQARKSLTELRREGEKQGSLWGFVTSKACFWLIWSSNGATVDSSDHLAKWMNGKSLKVTYVAPDGSKKDIEFSLAGSLTTIQQATGLTAP